MSEATWEEPSDLIIEQIEIGPMQNYTYLIGCRSTREVVLVDPAWDIDSLVSHINEKDYTLTAALATHYHPDHVGGSFSGNQVEGYAKLLETNPVKLYAHNLKPMASKRSLRCPNQISPAWNPATPCVWVTLKLNSCILLDTHPAANASK